MPLDTDSSMMRISCASLCRIEIDDKYLVLLNRNRRQKGIYQLSPVGGAIEIDDWSVLGHLNLNPEKPSSSDLRFFLDVDKIEAFRSWFYKRQDREVSPFRELYEELVEESGALFNLKRDDVAIRYLHSVEDRKQTLRKGLTGQFTHYFFEIYAVSFRSMDVILRLKTTPPNAGIVFLTADQMRQGASLKISFDGKVRTVSLNTEYLFAEGETPS